MINSSILHVTYFNMVYSLIVFLPKVSSTSLTHAADFSQYCTNKLATDILGYKSAWTFPSFLFLFLGHLTHFLLCKILSSLALGGAGWGHHCACSSFIFFFGFFFLSPEILFSPGSFSWFFPFHFMCNS